MIGPYCFSNEIVDLFIISNMIHFPLEYVRHLTLTHLVHW